MIVTQYKFPPKTAHPDQVSTFLNILGCVLGPKSAVYLSAPITSGKRFSQWFAKNMNGFDSEDKKVKDDHFREVIKPNLTHAKVIVGRVKAALGETLIDPTAVDDIADWNQDDFR